MSDSEPGDEAVPAGAVADVPATSRRPASPWLESDDREEEAARVKREHVRNELEKFASAARPHRYYASPSPSST